MSWPITAADLRKELRYAPTQGDAEELNLYAAAATERIEQEIGKVTGQVITATATGPTNAVRFFDRAERLTSITVNGASISLEAFALETGAIVRGPFPAGTILIRALAPLDDSALVILAARRLAALWFKQSKNGPHGQPDSQDIDPGGMMGIGIPRVVKAMLEGRDDLPGIA